MVTNYEILFVYTERGKTEAITDQRYTKIMALYWYYFGQIFVRSINWICLNESKLIFSSHNSKFWKNVLKEEKNHKQNNYDDMKLGRIGSESWAKRSTNIREWDSLSGMQHLRRKVKLWNFVLYKSGSDKWHNKGGWYHVPWLSLLPKCFTFESLEAFMRSWMNFRGQCLEARMLSTSSFPNLKTGNWKSFMKCKGDRFHV